MSADLLERGYAALAGGDWVAARDLFEEALRAEQNALAENGLGDALWWLGETHASIEHRERAFAGFRAGGDHERAVNTALGLSVHYRANAGNDAAARGWLARARRIVADEELEPFRGWIALFDAGEQSDPAAVERVSREALALARTTGDLDLELCALAQIGSALVSQGRVAEGVALLDEAMAGSLAGEGGTFDTVVFTSCNMIGSCTRCAEFERAIQWIAAADRFTDKYGCPFLYLYCRVHYAEILVATGDWIEAEKQLHVALRESESAQLPLHVAATAVLANLRLLQGDVEEADRLVEQFVDQPLAAATVAGVQLARGEAAAAAARTIERVLGDVDPLGRSLLVEMLGVARLASEDRASAEADGRALIEEGERADCALIRARGHRLVGRATRERLHLDDALREFARLGMPYESALTRWLIAGIEQDAVAVEEARAALTAFDRLGARSAADEAAAFLRERGVKVARKTPATLGALTAREIEVLGLIKEGLSNPEIAARLYLSRKTVEHHVASILTKLGAKDRGTAARLFSHPNPPHR